MSTGGIFVRQSSGGVTKTFKLQPHIENKAAENITKATTAALAARTSNAEDALSAQEQQQTPVNAEKPSLLPKPKVKVVIPAKILQQQQQQLMQQQQKEEEAALAAVVSRIPVRTAKAEKLAAAAAAAAAESAGNTLNANAVNSRALINAEKRASWRAARLRSLEQGAIEAQEVIQNMSKMTEEYLEPILSEVETCQEKIISLELQDPEKSEEQEWEDSLENEEAPMEMQSANAAADIEMDDDDDAASIVTVHANSNKLFLRSDEEAYSDGQLSHEPSSIESSISNSSRVTIKPAALTLHQTLSKEVPVSVLVQQIPNAAAAVTTNNDQADNTIVEVLNPLIAGEGFVQQIAVGRLRESDYPPSFDNDEYDNYKMQFSSFDMPTEDERDEPLGAAAVGMGMGVLRSDTFTFPAMQVRPREELSLNAKMKNVLEELLENERVKLNLQKSLEKEESDDEAACFGFVDGIEVSTADKNGNETLLDALIRDSNEFKIAKLAAAISADTKDNGDDEDEDEDDDEDKEKLASDEDTDADSSDSTDSDDDDDDNDDDDDETVHITFGESDATKLQKSQTYTTMQQAEEAADKLSSDTAAQPNIESTVEKLRLEQQKLAEISKQIRKSVENLLSNENDNDNKAEQTKQKVKVISPKGQNKNRRKESEQQDSQEDAGSKQRQQTTVVTEIVTEMPGSVAQLGRVDSGEELFNKLLNAGGNLKQIFDEQTGESRTVTTTTETEGTGSGSAKTIVTTTTTISNIATSGIPRVVVRDVAEVSTELPAVAAVQPQQQPSRLPTASSGNNSNNNNSNKNAGRQQKRKSKSGKK